MLQNRSDIIETIYKAGDLIRSEDEKDKLIERLSYENKMMADFIDRRIVEIEATVSKEVEETKLYHEKTKSKGWRKHSKGSKDDCVDLKAMLRLDGEATMDEILAATNELINENSSLKSDLIDKEDEVAEYRTSVITFGSKIDRKVANAKDLVLLAPEIHKDLSVLNELSDLTFDPNQSIIEFYKRKLDIIDGIKAVISDHVADYSTTSDDSLLPKVISEHLSALQEEIDDYTESFDVILRRLGSSDGESITSLTDEIKNLSDLSTARLDTLNQTRLLLNWNGSVDDKRFQKFLLDYLEETKVSKYEPSDAFYFASITKTLQMREDVDIGTVVSKIGSLMDDSLTIQEFLTAYKEAFPTRLDDKEKLADILDDISLHVIEGEKCSVLLESMNESLKELLNDLGHTNMNEDVNSVELVRRDLNELQNMLESQEMNASILNNLVLETVGADSFQDSTPFLEEIKEFLQQNQLDVPLLQVLKEMVRMSEELEKFIMKIQIDLLPLCSLQQFLALKECFTSSEDIQPLMFENFDDFKNEPSDKAVMTSTLFIDRKCETDELVMEKLIMSHEDGWQKKYQEMQMLTPIIGINRAVIHKLDDELIQKADYIQQLENMLK